MTGESRAAGPPSKGSSDDSETAGDGPEHGGTGRGPVLPSQDPRRRGRVERGTPGHRCELCGGPVLDRHCKVVCVNCGFQRDCSDP